MSIIDPAVQAKGEMSVSEAKVTSKQRGEQLLEKALFITKEQLWEAMRIR